jgi:Protein kinase domain/FHA domain
LPVLIFESGPEKGKTIRLEEDRVYTLGRDERAEIRLDIDLASRVHAKLRGKDGNFYLKDADSSNGTFVNDTRIEAVHELSSGDRISIGSFVLSYFTDTDAGGAAGKTLGGFQLLQRLGRGGMGTVYRALQKSLNREVALKILAPELARDQKFIVQFLKEARAAGQLNHPNIVAVYDVETDGSFAYYAMEYMKGGSVEDRINKIASDGPIPIDQALGWLLDAARGLQYAEMKRIVHRDIKPDNLMLTDLATVKIADLGLALASHEGHGDVGIHGTPHFISPEQARGERLDTRSDLYSLGATAFRILTGRTLFTGESAQEILRKQVKDAPPSVKSLRSDCPDKVSAIVARLLAKDPAQRYQTAAELIAAIEVARAKSNRLAGVAVALLLIVVVTGAAGWYLGWFGGGNTTQVVQQVVMNQGDADRANEAEERAKRAERESRALQAMADLANKRPALTDREYLAALKEFVVAHPATEVAARAQSDADALEAAVTANEAAAAARAEELAAATGRLEAAIAPPLAARAFTDAYGAVAAPGYTTDELATSAEFSAALAAARGRIDGAVEAAANEWKTAIADALAASDFATARGAVAAAAAAFSGGERLPDSELAARNRLTALFAEYSAAPQQITAAEAAWVASTRAADLASLLGTRDWFATFDSIRKLAAIDTAAWPEFVATLRTDDYRAIANRLGGDLEAYSATLAEVRAAIASGALTNAKVPHPERDVIAEIQGFGTDADSIVLQVAKGAGKSSAAVPLAAFDSPEKFRTLVDGRIAADPKSAANAVRATLLVAAAGLAPALRTIEAQLAAYSPDTGITDAQRAALSGIYIPTLDPSKLENWLTALESDPATAAEGALLRKRAVREARALDLLATALQPFADAKSEVRFGFAADQLAVIVEELRDTLAFFAAYRVFDDGSAKYELSSAP